MTSDTAWNVEALRSSARTKGANLDRVSELINSIGRSAAIFRYHMATARDALNGIVNDAEPQRQENFMLILGMSEKHEEFAFAKLVGEANVIACLHTARNMWDMFAQLANALILEKPISVGACDIGRVLDAMPPSELETRLRILLDSHWYKYVAAFSNTAKHRRLVQHSMTVSIEENRIGFRIGAFSYGDKSFPAYWGHEVLEGAIEVKNGIIECGRLLNTVYIGEDANPGGAGGA